MQLNITILVQATVQMHQTKTMMQNQQKKPQAFHNHKSSGAVFEIVYLQFRITKQKQQSRRLNSYIFSIELQRDKDKTNSKLSSVMCNDLNSMLTYNLFHGLYASTRPGPPGYNSKWINLKEWWQNQQNNQTLHNQKRCSARDCFLKNSELVNKNHKAEELISYMLSKAER